MGFIFVISVIFGKSLYVIGLQLDVILCCEEEIFTIHVEQLHWHQRQIIRNKLSDDIGSAIGICPNLSGWSVSLVYNMEPTKGSESASLVPDFSESILKILLAGNG